MDPERITSGLNGSGPNDSFRVGDHLVTPSANEIDGVRVESKAMEVLVALAAAAPGVLSSATLLERVWPNVVVVDNVVHQAVAHLRKALGDEAHAPRYIGTIPRRGYRLVAEVRREASDARASPPAISSVAVPSIEPLRASWGASKPWLAVCIAAVVAAAAALLVFGPDLGSRPSPNNNDGRIEVGTFEPLTKTAELERFAKGTGGTVVRVLATNSIKAIERDSAGAGSGGVSTGDAEFALHGRVDRDGDDLVASADIVNRRDGLVLWSLTKRRDAMQLQVLQEQFSASIAIVLRCGLDIRRLSGDSSTDLLAQYLRLCEAIHDNQWEQTPELTRRIVETAPQNAVSYGIQSVLNALLTVLPTSSGASRPPAEIARLRKIVYDSARIAAEIDPRIDSAYARAVVVDPAVGLAEREKLLQKSIEDEAETGAAYAYGTLLWKVGRIREAYTYVERAVNENPLETKYLVDSAFLGAWLGNVQAARDAYKDMRGKQILTDAQADEQLFRTELFFGDPAIAKALNAGDKITPERCEKGFVDAVGGHTRLSEEEMDALCPDGWDVFYGYLGYVDKAFLRAEATGTPDVDPLSAGNRGLFIPHMRVVRADPRFMPLAARLGLVDYWLETDHWPDFCTTEKLPYDCKEAALAARAEDAARNLR